MTDHSHMPLEQRAPLARQTKFLLTIASIAGGLLVAYILFSFVYTALAPERLANPADIFDHQTPSEGVGVPDGGEMTNEPNQAAPDSPARVNPVPQ